MGNGLVIEAAYVDLFDWRPRHLAAPVRAWHGDSRERGPAMIDLAQTYEKAGATAGRATARLPAGGAEFGLDPAPAGGEGFLRDGAHIQRDLRPPCVQRGTPYRLHPGRCWNWPGEKAQPRPADQGGPLDEALGRTGSSSTAAHPGQAKPGTPQPIHMCGGPAPLPRQAGPGVSA